MDQTLTPVHSHGVVVAVAVIGFVLLLAILLLFPRVLNAVGLLIERRRTLQPEERARLALAAPYAAVNGMNDVTLTGLPPLRRQSIWNYLARECGIPRRSESKAGARPKGPRLAS